MILAKKKNKGDCIAFNAKVFQCLSIDSDTYEQVMKYGLHKIRNTVVSKKKKDALSKLREKVDEKSNT